LHHASREKDRVRLENDLEPYALNYAPREMHFAPYKIDRASRVKQNLLLSIEQEPRFRRCIKGVFVAASFRRTFAKERSLDVGSD
jgi:hypothetical protein